MYFKQLNLNVINRVTIRSNSISNSLLLPLTSLYFRLRFLELGLFGLFRLAHLSLDYDLVRVH